MAAHSESDGTTSNRADFRTGLECDTSDAAAPSHPQFRDRAALAAMLLPTPFLAAIVVTAVLLLLVAASVDTGSQPGIPPPVRSGMLGALVVTYLLGFGISMQFAFGVRDWIRDRYRDAGLCGICDYPVAAGGTASPPVRCPECGTMDWNLGEPPRRMRRWAQWAAATHGIGAALLVVACVIAALTLAFSLQLG